MGASCHYSLLWQTHLGDNTKFGTELDAEIKHLVKIDNESDNEGDMVFVLGLDAISFDFGGHNEAKLNEN